MCIFSWFKNCEKQSMKRFIELLNDNNNLQEEINYLYKALSFCGQELYKHTGDFDHLMPSSWINKVKKELG